MIKNIPFKKHKKLDNRHSNNDESPTAVSLK